MIVTHPKLVKDSSRDTRDSKIPNVDPNSLGGKMEESLSIDQKKNLNVSIVG